MPAAHSALQHSRKPTTTPEPQRFTKRKTPGQTTEVLAAAAQFPSASALADRLGVSRPTVAKALDRLEAAGVLAGGGQGKVRTVRAVPIREERS
ncbi:GntR family transcriptional regulator [Streptomyces actinomycinicus]|uniref:GntR family transcriptional regulator n=1 Tax=Streptomyces actinomycinicus TaxID=1695166 RepID=UPI001EFFEE51|nr:GntR family transcriptional regulator [Streptomyces actinomycinicus]